jgi:hypothetical protein
MSTKKEGLRQFSINIPNSLFDDITGIASYCDRDRSKQIVRFLRKSVGEFKASNPGIQDLKEPNNNRTE